MLVKQCQKGFSLLEIMITVFVMASGLLGLAYAQFSSLNANQEAYFRTQALNLATSLSSRFRANEDYFIDEDVDTNIYSSDVKDAYYQYCRVMEGMDVESVIKDTVDCSANVCNQEQLARYDIRSICLDEFENVKMPEGEMGVKCHDADATDLDPCSPGSLMSIYVAWRNKAVRSDSVEDKISPNLQCLNALWKDMSDEELKGRRCVKLDFLP